MALNPARQHLRLHSPDALAVDIQRTVGITVSPREIAQPTPYLVELLYVKYIQIIFALDFDDYLMDLHNQPEVPIADTMVLNIVTRYLRLIMRLTAGISLVESNSNKVVSFDIVRLSDITEPNPTRTRILLSSLINMVNLRDAELELYTRVIGQLHRLTNDRTTAEGEIEKLTQEVKEQRAIVEEREKLLEDDIRKKEEKEQNVAEAKKIRRKQREELKDLKNECAQAFDRLKTLNESVAESDRRVTELRRRIVKSPERVKSEITNMGDIVLEKRQEVQERQEMNRALQAKFGKLTQIERDGDTIKEHLETLEAVLKDKEQQASLVQSIRDAIDKNKIEYKEEITNKETWEKKGEGARERITTFQMRMATERNDLSARMVEGNEEYERVTQERGEADERMDSERKMVSEIEKEIASLVANSEKEAREALGDYWRLMVQLDEYMATIAKRLQLSLPSE